MWRKMLLILSGNASAALLLIVRNLIVARLIPVEDYGIAATFAMTMALVEMTTQFGLQQQIIQDKDGEDPHFQAVLQGFQLLRGLVAGGLLFALAGPIASFLRIPEVAWAYQVMAVMPVLRSLQHFDIHRLNRTMRFGPMLWTSVVPALVSLAVVFPLALWLGDFRVMLWALVLQETLGALTSHLVAERRYRLAADWAIAGNSLRFGWPLLLNGVLLFLVMQGDKVIVGREIGMVALGIFGMGVTLTLTPTLILAKTTQNFFLPMLSKAEAGTAANDRLNTTILQAVMLLSLFFVVGIILAADPLVHGVLGEKFAPLVPLLPWLALVQAFRILKVGPTVIVIARGQTKKLVWANIPRAVLLVPTFWIVTEGGGLLSVVLMALVGESLGFFITMALVRKGLRLGSLVVSTLATVFVLGLCAIQAGGWLPGPSWAGILMCLLALTLALPTFRPLAQFIRSRTTT